MLRNIINRTAHNISSDPIKIQRTLLKFEKRRKEKMHEGTLIGSDIAMVGSAISIFISPVISGVCFSIGYGCRILSYTHKKDAEFLSRQIHRLDSMAEFKYKPKLPL